MATPKSPQPAEKPATEDAAESKSTLIDQMVVSGLHLHMDQIVAHLEALRADVRGPHHAASQDDTGLPKVHRRRSLDDMQFALNRLESGQPRPVDDDSPLVLQDAINEVIALRQTMNTLMQASNNVYQGGLVAIRNMTAQ